MAEQKSMTQDQLAAQALSDPSIPKIYANGFVFGMSTSDVFVVLQLGGVPIAVLNLSYTLAKTLATILTNTLNDLEQKTGQTVLTTKDIEEKIMLPQRKEAQK